MKVKVGQRFGDMVVKFVEPNGYICINEEYLRIRAMDRYGGKKLKEKEKEIEINDEE